MARFPQIRSEKSVFPSPEPGEVVQINPPSLQWVAEPGVERYRVRVESLPSEQVVAEGETVYNFFRFRDQLEPGDYRWNVYAGEDERGWSAFTVPADAWPFRVPTAKEVLAALPESHPRHIYFPEDLPELRERCAPELEVLKRNIALALEQGFMKYPDFWHETGRIRYRDALDEAREHFDRNLVACALGWLFLEDRAAGEFAREAVLHICEWNPAGPASVQGPWGDEVGLSICRTLPAVFDWTWNLYTESERLWIQRTLAQHARQIVELLDAQKFLANPGESHSGRLPGYLGEMALVLSDFLPPETTEQYLTYVLDFYGSIFPHYGGRDGGWAEGVFYASSYTKWYLPFFLAVERLTGFSFLCKPFYRNLSQFFLHFAPPGQEAHPFGDGHWPTRTEWPGFQAQNPFGIYADRFGPEEARRFSRQLNSEIDRFELHLLDVIRPAAAVAHPDAAGPAMNSRVFRDTGFVSMRRCVADPKRDVALLARCSRYGTPSHQHADQGNFAILAGGHALIVPSGSFGYQFGEEHHRVWTMQTVAQNCILVDGRGQRKGSAEAVGRILEFGDDGAEATALFDLSAAYPMLKSYRRRLVFNRMLLSCKVVDEIAAEEPVVIDWRLHSYSEPRLTGNRVVIERGTGRVEFEVNSSLGKGFRTVTDRFEYPAGSGTGVEPKRKLLRQFHQNWQFPAAKELRITADFEVSLRVL